MKQAIVLVLLAGLAAVVLGGCGSSHHPRVVLKGFVTDNVTYNDYGVKVYQSGHARDDHYVVATAAIPLDSEFEVLVYEGTYDVEFLSGWTPEQLSSREVIEGVVVTGPVTDMGTIGLWFPVP